MGPRIEGRLVGLDVARCLALLGMVATHVLDSHTPAGDLTTAQWLAGGRASALFAVLAGVSLALMTPRPLPPREAGVRMGALAVRALLIAAIGFALGELETGIAIILAYYGVLFLVGLPFTLIRSVRTLALLAAVWVVAAPVVSQLVRPDLPERGWGNPTLDQLGDPAQLASELLLTGYYPVLPWLAYLLAGLALGRLGAERLRDLQLLAALAIGGLGLAILATAISRDVADPGRAIDGAAGMYGVTPADGDWSWLLLVAPHSATPFDLAQTIGTSVLVIACCLLVERLLPRRAVPALAIAFGAGTMTLTLYSLHVVMRTEAVWPDETPESFLIHLVVLLGIGAVVTALGRRGPLETLVGLPLRLVAHTRVVRLSVRQSAP